MYWVHAQMVVLALCASNAHFGASWCMSFIPLLLARPCFNAKASMPRHRHKDDYRYQLKMKSKLLVARKILELRLCFRDEGTNLTSAIAIAISASVQLDTALPSTACKLHALASGDCIHCFARNRSKQRIGQRIPACAKKDILTERPQFGARCFACIVRSVELPVQLTGRRAICFQPSVLYEQWEKLSDTLNKHKRSVNSGKVCVLRQHPPQILH